MIAQAVLREGVSANNRQKLKQHLASALDEASQLVGREPLLAALGYRETLCQTLFTEGNPTIRIMLAVVGAVDLKLSAPR